MNYYGKEYDLDNPKIKSKVKAFEERFLEWYRNNDMEDQEGALEKFLAHKGAIKFQSSSGYKIVDVAKYEKLNGLWEALQDLRRRRDYAKEKQREALDDLAESFQESNFIQNTSNLPEDEQPEE